MRNKNGDIELVIKIPEELKEALDNAKKENAFNYMQVYNDTIYDALKNGIKLPKGHGDLKDANKLKHAFISWSMAVQGNFTDADIASIVYNSPTIIEAYKAER